MSKDNALSQSTQDLSARISEFATTLKSAQTELGNRIDDIVEAGIWVGPTAPPDTSKYVGWAKITAVDYDLYVNTGTISAPNWTSVLRTVKRPSNFNVPFKTSERWGNRIVWAVDVDIGTLPNNTVKVQQLPPSITSIWASVPERWIDTASSYAYDASSGYVCPLPMTSRTTGGGILQTTRSDNILLYLDQDSVTIRTESDKRNLKGVVRINYLTA